MYYEKFPQNILNVMIERIAVIMNVYYVFHVFCRIENPLHRSIQQQSQNHGGGPIDQRQAYMAVLQQQQAALRENRLGDSSRSQRLKSDGSDNEHVPAER